MERNVRLSPQDKEQMLSYFEAEVMQVLNWLAAFSPDEEGGITRLLYTDGWLETQQALAVKMASYGLSTSFDNVGNLFGKLQGEDMDAPSIITGSHIDTVVQGGMYDGAYGIAAGLLALDYLHKHYGKPKRTLELVSLCEEEGSRFPMAYWGSGSIVGKRNFEQIVHLQDSYEVFFADAMQRCGFGEGTARDSRRHDIGAFIEVHIEQGAVLEKEGIAIGVVDTIAGQRRLKFEVVGESNHAGTTPMHMRRDALEGVSMMIQTLRQETIRIGSPLVATVGRLQVQPNVPNVVPGKVIFTVDARHADEAALDCFCRWVLGAFASIAADRQLELHGTEWFREEPVPMNERLKQQLDAVCGELSISSKRMISGAGHDAQMFEHICPTAMLFVPSRRGISHSPEEYTEPSELAVGVLVLTELLYRLGYEGEEL
ncbi:allantoate deiminase [Paenibacillus endophyticus]|uniref:Allantoate deiminase n=1 Tax=Paenibacillus endophyticus TaxID=1294268 RepID=A0A7W5C8T6_9BACL|nr:allantoate deiminase [Paenibacillus endophyticus]MBB3153241.1 allantoate deiminase [Paenibacillus endophyticus]